MRSLQPIFLKKVKKFGCNKKLNYFYEPEKKLLTKKV